MAMKTDFETYKDTYKCDVESSIAFVGQDLDFFTGVKARHLLALTQKYLGDPEKLSVLDVGCGVGETDRFLISKFKTLHGVDIAEGVIAEAKRKNPSAHYQLYDGAVLPFHDNTFDLVFAICVIHHVSPQSWSSFTSEMRRVVKKGGLVIIFEHNPFNPLTRLAVDRCEFDADAVLLKRSRVARLLTENSLNLVERRFILFFPWRSSVLAGIERGLTWLPLGAQYYAAGQKVAD